MTKQLETYCLINIIETKSHYHYIIVLDINKKRKGL